MDNRVRLTLAAHLLKHLAEAQAGGARLDLDQLEETLPESRMRIRQALTRLHEEGLLDVVTMRLTLPGFTLGRAFAGRKLHRLDKRSPGRSAPQSQDVAA